MTNFLGDKVHKTAYFKHNVWSGLALLGTLIFVGACGEETNPTALTLDLAVAADHTSGGLAHIEVCKAGFGSGSFVVTPAGLVEGAIVMPGPFDLAAGNCVVVADVALIPEMITQVNVSITETPAPGTVLTGVEWVETFVDGTTSASTPIANGGIVTASDDSRITVTFTGEAAPPPPSLDGRMTGGGSAFTTDGTRITHGFELHCDLSEPNRLQVNWEGNRFHMTSLSSALCTDDPDLDEGRPKAGFDTFDGTGVGRYNGVDGFDIRFQFTDDGEPGTGDLDRIVITDPSNGDVVIMSVSNFLDRGNHQAHK